MTKDCAFSYQAEFAQGAAKNVENAQAKEEIVVENEGGDGVDDETDQVLTGMKERTAKSCL